MALEIGGDAKRLRLPPAVVDHLSALPEPLQLRILSFLPLRSAILASSFLPRLARPVGAPLALRREPVLLPPPPPPALLHAIFLFPFPAAAGPALARISLRGIWVSGPCAALEAVLLHSVRLDDRDLARMLALCPRLRVLGLHSCTGALRVAVTAAMGLTSLRSVTIVDCTCLTAVDFAAVPSLRSFRYTGGIFSPFCLPGDALFADLHIRFGVQKSRNVLICQKVFSDWFESRVCSKLTTLTICSNVLFVVSSLLNATSHAESTKMGGDLFRSMTELKLLMFEMKAPELANIHVFLKKSGCSNLERLFVQLSISPREPLVDSFDYVGLEPPPDVLENLKVVKITNFNWNRYELQLVFFLLRKASSLRKLVLITPRLEPLHVHGIQQADLLFLAEAVANGKVILSGSDDAATQPFHSDVSADFKTFSCFSFLKKRLKPWTLHQSMHPAIFINYFTKV